jgi:hypothetical protein
MKQIHEIRHRRYGQLIKEKLKPGQRIRKAGLIKKGKTKMHMIRWVFQDADK